MVLIAVAGTHAVQRLLIRCPNSLDQHICISSTGALFCGDEVLTMTIQVVQNP